MYFLPPRFTSTRNTFSKGLEYIRRQAKGKGEKIEGQQPVCRKDYSIRMGGADKADQYNSFYAFFIGRTGTSGDGCSSRRYSKVSQTRG
ncbi:unnamed protein product [Ascophyllum nodosum]